MDVVAEVLEKSAKDAEKFKPITVKKHLELEFDVGTLLVTDNNELDKKLITSNINDYLLDLTRDNVQLLANEIWKLPTSRVEEAVVAKLPASKFILPRFKRVPRPKPLTKWQQFAKEKGIQKKKKSKVSWDDQLQKWIPTFGMKRAQAQKEKDWVLEVPQNADPMEDQFAKKSQVKAEKIAKNELQRLRNIAKAKNVKVPKAGILTPDVATAKDLKTAVTVAKASTASMGKFQSKLPKEKEARGVADITPGATRKRKMPPIPGKQERSENMDIIDTILNKRPKINIEKAVARQINEEQVTRSNEKQTVGKKGRKGPKSNFKGAALAKKPKSTKGGRKSVKSGGRKRR